MLATSMAKARGALEAVSRRRFISYVSSFAEIRQRAYKSKHSLSVVLAALCALLMAVTACGIIGLVLYWVAQRRRQIGMRRALGARRTHILHYVQLENLLITLMGASLGIALALGANLWLVSSFAIVRLNATYLLLGVLTVLALGQLASLWPALRAAAVAARAE
jgi:putative ABC transport system permease protein